MSYQSINPYDGKTLKTFAERFLAPEILKPSSGIQEFVNNKLVRISSIDDPA